ncbi:hypothetical protein LINPERHAP2_LOCUS1077, partial [Linum perenne]
VSPYTRVTSEGSTVRTSPFGNTNVLVVGSYELIKKPQSSLLIKSTCTSKRPWKFASIRSRRMVLRLRCWTIFPFTSNSGLVLQRNWTAALLFTVGSCTAAN